MKNIIVFLSLLLVVSCVGNQKETIWDNKEVQIIVNEKQAVWDNQETQTLKDNVEVKWLSFEELYVFINKGKNLEKKVWENEFAYLVNNMYFGTYLTKNKWEYFINNKDWIENFLNKYFNNFTILKWLKSNNDILNSSLNTKYSNEWDSFIYYNKDKEYFYDLKKIYEMNGVCALTFWLIDSFTDFNWATVKSETSLEPIESFFKENISLYVSDFWGELISEKELENIDASKEYKYDEVEEILYSYVNQYNVSWDKTFTSKFMDIFSNNLWIDYSYEVYTLFLGLQKLNWEDASYCDTFNKEYFLWQ